MGAVLVEAVGAAPALEAEVVVEAVAVAVAVVIMLLHLQLLLRTKFQGHLSRSTA